MTTPEIASMAFGALGLGGGAVALYIRGTIAETIIGKLNGRYVGSGICGERHTSLTAQLSRIESRSEMMTKRVAEGFDSVREQLVNAQNSRENIDHEVLARELRKLAAEHGHRRDD